MKKLLALILALACLLALTACGAKLEEPPELNLVSSGGEGLETPPELRIVSADGTVTASKGTSSWMYHNGFNWVVIESDSIHPLEYKDIVETLFTDDTAVTLEFDVTPDSITAVECWSDTHWGDDYTTEGESFVLTGDKVTLNQSGGWIYYIRASWDRENYDGNCRYVFHVVTPELQATP